MPNDIRTNDLGPCLSEGARQLWACLTRFGGQNALERELGAPRGLVSRWLHCRVTPSTRWAVRITEVTGITADAWMKRPRRPIVLVVHT